MSDRKLVNLIDDEHGCVVVEFLEGQPFIHLSLRTKWTPSIYRRAKRELKDILEALRQLGFTHLFAYNAHQDDLWKKFIKGLGFTHSFDHNNLNVYQIVTE